MPICGEEFIFEMTASCLLLPRANGVPTWQSDEPGERVMQKLPIQFQTIFADSKPLSEEIGEQLAQWAAGGAPRALGEDYTALVTVAREKAKGGRTVMEAHWKSLSKAERLLLKDVAAELKTTANEADAMRAEAEPAPASTDVI
jgi:hypothetical protein